MGTQSPYPSNFDNVTHAFNTIDYSHHEIHSGSHYVVTDYDEDVDIASPKYWHIKTADTAKWCHLLGLFKADKAGVLEFFENPTTTDDGTELTPYNNNRNSSNTAGTSFYYNPTVSSDGTRIYVYKIGVDGNPSQQEGGANARENEFILKQNEQYLLKFSPLADNTLASVVFEFYEHTNKADL